MGIAKIDTTKRIAKDAARQVTFSKRRSGLFKKAFELSILCELELAIIVFSQKGKVFTFAHPDIDYVIAKYRDPDNVEPYDEEKLREIHAGVEHLIPRYDQAIEQSKIGKERNQWLKQVRSKVDRKWWESLDIDNMSLQELQRESQELQSLLKLFHDHQAYEQQGTESSQLLIHQPQLPLLLPGPSSEEPMMLHNPAPPQLWQSRGPVFGDSGHMAAMPRPAAPGSMMSMQWQQPSSSGGFRDPNLLVSANMRHVLGPQNYMYPGAQPMTSFPRVIYGQHFRPQGRDIPTPGSYHPQDHVQQQQQEQQQLFFGGRATPTYHPGPDYMHQYHINQQNQQTKHMETFQVGRPLINYAPQLQSPPMGPLMGQYRPHEPPSHYQGYPYNYAWDSQNFGEPRYEGNQFCGNVRMLNFHLPYDNMGHGPGLPSTSSLNRNFISSGTRMPQIGQGIQAEGDSGSDVAPDDGEVNSGPSSRKIVNSEDCRYSFDSNLAYQNNLAFQDMENVDAAEQYESYGVHESADISQGEHDSEYTQDQGL